MDIKRLRLWAAICGSLCLTFLAGRLIVQACAGEDDPYNYFIRFFRNDLAGDKVYKPFYYTSHIKLWDEEERVNEYEINAQEWSDYLKNGTVRQDVYKVMYGLDSAANDFVLDSYFNGNGQLPDSLKANTFLRAMNNGGASYGAVRYYTFAREAEPLVNRPIEYYWEAKPADTTGDGPMAEKALAMARGEKDEFLKLRYYYQAQRLYHYGRQYNKSLDVYNEGVLPSRQASRIKNWAKLLEAGALRRTGDTLRAACMFAQAFNTTPERRVQAYLDYHFIGAPVDSVLAIAKTPAERLAIYTVESFGNPAMTTKYLYKLLELNASDTLLTAMVAREVNKIEDWYLTPAIQPGLYNAVNGISNSKYKPAGSYSTPTEDTAWIMGYRNVMARAQKQADTGKSKPATAPVQVQHGGWGIKAVLLMAAALTLLVVALVYFLMYRRRTDNRTLPMVLALSSLGLGILFLILGLNARAAASHYKKGFVSQGEFFTAQEKGRAARYNRQVENLRAFCNKLLPQHADLGNITLAYLDFLENKPEDGLARLENVSYAPAGNLKQQKNMTELLLTCQHIDVFNRINEHSLLHQLNWLDRADSSSVHEWFYHDILAPAYWRKGDTTKAVLALMKSGNMYVYGSGGYWPANNGNVLDDILNSGQLEALLSFKQARLKDAYNIVLGKGINDYSTDNLKEKIGRAYLREHQYQKAVNVLQGLPDSVLTWVKGQNLFEARINDFPRRADSTLKPVSMLDFARQMLRLQRSTQTSSDNAPYYYAMANGLYNTSRYGLGDVFTTNYTSTTDYFADRHLIYDDDFLRLKTAKLYYGKALAAARDNEMRARCAFMIAKCTQKQPIAPDYGLNSEQYTTATARFNRQVRSNPDMRQFAAKYRNTAFFKEVYSRCSYLKDFNMRR